MGGPGEQNVATCIMALTQHQGHTSQALCFRNRSSTRVASKFYNAYYKKVF